MPPSPEAPVADDDDLDVPTIIRLAVASGDPVVVRGAAVWVPQLREAAAVCGRLSDLIFLENGPGPSPRKPVRSLYLDPVRLGFIPIAKDASRDAETARLEMPRLECGDLSVPAPIVFVQETHRSRSARFAGDIARLHLRLAPGSTHVRYVRVRGYPSGDVQRDVDGMAESWIRPGAGAGRGRPASRDRPRAWAESVAAYRALPGPEWDGDGVSHERFGIKAFVHSLPGPHLPDAYQRVAVHAACDDGWIGSGIVAIKAQVGSRDDRDARAELALSVTRGDIDIALLPGPNSFRGPMESDRKALVELRAHIAHAPAAERLRRSVDVETFLATTASGGAGIHVLRAIRAASGNERARMDFVRTWPIAAEHILRTAGAAEIDSGARTLPIVARMFEMPHAIARRTSSLPSLPLLHNDSQRPWGLTMPLGAILQAFGHDRLPPPGDRDDGTAFVHCLDAVAMMLRFAGSTLERVDPRDIARLLIGIPGRTWREKSMRLPETMGEDAGELMGGLADWLNAMGHEEADVDTAFALLSDHRSLVDLIAASERWHATPALASWSGAIPHDATWPVPFGPVDLGQGWSAVALGSLAELKSEGMTGRDPDGREGLSHCVAGYGVTAMEATSIIVSLRRDADGIPVRISTSEIEPSEGGDWRLADHPYRLAQHKGIRNVDPSAEAKAALLRLRQSLASGVVPIDAIALERRWVEEGEKGREHAEAVFDLWRPLLPKRLASLGTDALLTESVATEARLEAHAKACRHGQGTESP